MSQSFPRARVEALLERRELNAARVVCIAEVGSTAHGIATGSDDLDYTVVRIESFAELVIGSPNRQSMMIRTQPEGIRSRFGDIDLQVYTLRKFCGLAAGGNPSILNVLFTTPHVLRRGWEPRVIAGYVASKAAGQAYLGYMRQQIERWQGVRGQKNVNRPELVEAHGYDTKYAGHAIRLAMQGIEYLSTGRITLPMPDDQRHIVLDVREGRVSEPNALAMALSLEADLATALANSPLPGTPNRHGLNSWLAATYRAWMESE